MKPVSDLEPIAVNICETCWEGARRGNASEFKELLDSQRYAWQFGVIWLHRLQRNSEPMGSVVCRDETLAGGLPRSLFEFQRSAWRELSQADPPTLTPEAQAHAAYEASDQVVRLNAALEAALATIDEGINTLANVLRDGLENIALAIRDQGRPL